MKELDFDELDKAVNSLMEGVPKDKPAAKPEEEDKGATLTISPTLGDDAKPDFANVEAQAAQSVTVTSTQPEPTPVPATTAPSISVPARSQATTPPASRRGGRFMDVVHPSSDMKQPTVPLRPVSRQGVTIAPSTASPSESAVVPEAPIEDTAKSEPSSMPTPTEPANEWPDPLDMAGFKQPEADTLEAPSKEGSEIEEEKPVVEPAAPLTSPFLADAKVEKRPLGGATPTVSDDDLLKPEDIRDDSFSTSDPNDQLPADPEKVDTPLPEELRSDLVAIESGAHMEQHAEDTMPDVPVEKEVKEEAEKETPAEDKKPAGLPPASKDTASDTPPAPAGPTSIAQQYKEEPNSGDQSSGAIYDTDTYHQPLEHPAKKKSGWMWVVWILLILVVGAGGGAALYFLGLI